MNYGIIAILALILILVFVILFIESMITKHKIKNSNEYGSARFSTFEEIKKNFKKEHINHITTLGFPIWFSKDYKITWMDKETPHWVYLGSTGSGKSVTQVIPFCSFLSSSSDKRSAKLANEIIKIFFHVLNLKLQKMRMYILT